MLSRKPEGLALVERHADERSEARFYYAILFPVCLIGSVASRLMRVAGLGPRRLTSPALSIWSEARRQVNTIVPYIMMR
jgi:hypothetical protein